MNALLKVVDASLAIKWLVEEEHSDEARALSSDWESSGVKTFAPAILMPAEVANALHRRVVRGELDLQTAARLLDDLLAFGIELVAPPEIHGAALSAASRIGQGAVYDSHYLALAERLDCELWTADRRFYRSARRAFPDRIRWIGEAAAP